MLLLIFAIFLLILAFYNFFWKRRNFPKGPTPLPLFGNCLSIASYGPPGYKCFNDWTKCFGPIFTVWLGEDPTVVVTDFALIKETFIKDSEAYAGRHYFTEIKKTLKGTGGGGVYGITQTEGDQWRIIRRFSLQIMRNLGMGTGRGKLEDQILKYIGVFIKDIEEEKAKGVNEHWIMHKTDDFAEVCDELQVNQLSITGHMLASTPWLKHLPVFSATYKRIDQLFAILYEFTDNQIEVKLKARKNSQINQNIESDYYKENQDQSFVDAFLDEIEKIEGNGIKNDEPNYFHMETLRHLCYDLFIAAQETVTSTINFMFIYLMLNLQVQSKLQEELDKFLIERGSDLDTPITMSDRPKLPYLNAMINETQRLANLIPINLTHRTTCDVKIGEYQFKRGTIIVPMISSVLFDERVFPEPFKFIPERFLDQNGRFKKYDEFIPFSIGKRQCTGEALARMELFLFAANFFKKFSISPNPSNPPSTEKRFYQTVSPYEFCCRIEVRRIFNY